MIQGGEGESGDAKIRGDAGIQVEAIVKRREHGTEAPRIRENPKRIRQFDVPIWSGGKIEEKEEKKEKKDRCR